MKQEVPKTLTYNTFGSFVYLGFPFVKYIKLIMVSTPRPNLKMYF